MYIMDITQKLSNFWASEGALSYEELQELDIEAFNKESIIGNWTY